MTGAVGDRRQEIAAGLASVQERIGSGCADAGRSADEVTLVVVTKFFPATDVRVLADLGVTHVGENRHQEAEEKAAACADLGLVWHYVGGLQSNKAAAVARYADVVESVDRVKLLAGLSRGAHEADRPLEVLLQVSLDDPGAHGRAGAAPEDVPELAEQVLGTEGLLLRGVMGIAPLGADPGPAFARLAEVAGEVRRVEPAANRISAGMSGDLETAIRHGATHVRVGSAILGPRPVIQ